MPIWGAGNSAWVYCTTASSSATTYTVVYANQTASTSLPFGTDYADTYAGLQAEWRASGQVRPPLSAEAIAAADRAARVLVDEADKRAAALLLANLTAEQAEDYRRTQSFVVVQPLQFGRPARRYRITFRLAGNVYLLDDEGLDVERYCIHAQEPIPVADNMLAQKLMLEADEEQFLRVANRTRLRAA